MSTSPKPITIDGVAYRSVSAAARAHGVPVSTLNARLLRNPDKSGAQALRADVPRTCAAATIDGVTYPSRRAAADALGISHKTVAARIAREIPVDMVCTLPAGLVTTLDGVTYRSRMAAARALGITPSAITHRVKRAALVEVKRMRADLAERAAAAPPQAAPLPKIRRLALPPAVVQDAGEAYRAKAAQLLDPIFHPHWSPAADHALLLSRTPGAATTRCAALDGRQRTALTQRYHQLRVIPNIVALLEDYGLSSRPYPSITEIDTQKGGGAA